MSKVRIPVLGGNLIGVFGCAFAIWLITSAPDINEVSLRFLLYLVAWGSLAFFPHCLTHFIVGRMVGIRFSNYSVGRSAIAKLRIPLVSAIASRAPLLTLKIEKSSLGSSSRGRRAVMFASGAAASMILPFFVAVASFWHLPLHLSLLLFVLSAANLTFDFYYSPKAGDISRIMTPY